MAAIVVPPVVVGVIFFACFIVCFVRAWGRTLNQQRRAMGYGPNGILSTSTAGVGSSTAVVPTAAQRGLILPNVQPAQPTTATAQGVLANERHPQINPQQQLAMISALQQQGYTVQLTLAPLFQQVYTSILLWCHLAISQMWI